MPLGAEQVTTWYFEQARPFLARHAADRLDALDAEIERMRRLEDARARERVVCVLGNSGVGKSTLLNALVSGMQPVLPQGGVGPLTAKAIEVRHADEDHFKVTYHSAAQLNRLVFALEVWHQAELRKLGQGVDDATGEVRAALTEQDVRDVVGAMAGADPREPSYQDRDERDQYVQQAKLLVRGTQFADDLPVTYLADALRTAMGLRRRWGTTLSEVDAPRLDRIRRCLDIARARGEASFRAGEDRRTFLGELRDHAAGFLAPLVQTIEVGWDSDLLSQGLVLVDLPGVGVANDDYRRVTQDRIRSARAVVLVVDRSGVTEASVNLLHSTGFFNSLLHDSHDAAVEPVSLVVAVVKLDEPANDAWKQDLDLNPDGSRSWLEHFNEQCARARDTVRGQLNGELQRLIEHGGAQTRDERSRAVQRILASVEIHPLSAITFQDLLRSKARRGPPVQIDDPEASRVPGLRRALVAMATDHRDRIGRMVEEAARGLHDRVMSSIEVVRLNWDALLKAEEERVRFLGDLHAFLEPRRRELAHRQGAFREFLRSTAPERIRATMGEVSRTAEDDIRKYLSPFEWFHWATLRAAVRRGGMFFSSTGACIDLPNGMTLRFEEPVAVTWSRILADLRVRTAELGSDYVAIVSEIGNWAESQPARVDARLAHALAEEMRAATRQLDQLGSDAVDDLKANVKARLYDPVSEEIQRRCDQFVEEGQDTGRGVRRRMLELFAELSRLVVDAARPAAERVLLDNYQEASEHIREELRRFGDPIETAARTLAGSGEASEDTEVRRAILAQADAVIAAAALPAEVPA